MGGRDDALIAAATRAREELLRTVCHLETIAGDTDDRHLAGRIHDAAARLAGVGMQLAEELDRHNPHTGWLRQLLTAGAFAMGLTVDVFANNLAERVDLVDLAAEGMGAVAAAISQLDGQLSDAAAAYWVEMQRFDAEAGGLDVLVDESDEPILDGDGQILLVGPPGPRLPRGLGSMRLGYEPIGGG